MLNIDEIRAVTDKATPIFEFPKYEVDEDGHVWSFQNWRGYGRREIIPTEGKSGYLKVRLTREDGTRANRYVHRLVAEAFLGPRPYGLQIRHLNGNCKDNRASNLAWGTAKENADDRERCGTTARGEKNGFSKLKQSDVLEIRILSKLGFSQRNIAKKFGVTQPCIGMVIRNETWKSV